jgi:hypothetical protein
MPTGIQHRADSRERRADLCIVGDIDDIACERHSEPDSQACAVNSGERWRGKRDDSLD